MLQNIRQNKAISNHVSYGEGKQITANKKVIKRYVK